MFTSCTLERSIDLQLPSRSPQVDAKVNTALVEVSAKEWNVSGNLKRDSYISYVPPCFSCLTCSC